MYGVCKDTYVPMYMITNRAKALVVITPYLLVASHLWSYASPKNKAQQIAKLGINRAGKYFQKTILEK